MEDPRAGDDHVSSRLRSSETTREVAGFSGEQARAARAWTFETRCTEVEMMARSRASTALLVGQDERMGLARPRTGGT